MDILRDELLADWIGFACREMQSGEADVDEPNCCELFGVSG